MRKSRKRISTGVGHLDRMLDGLYIGDNVIWYDDAGSLASLFCLNFLQSSWMESKPLIYISFDRSPKNLLDRLGPLAKTELLTILDCFTYGKGSASEVFLKFYKGSKPKEGRSIITVKEPRNVDEVMDAFYGIHGSLNGDVRFIFESLTGMEAIWGEEALLQFYAHSCPRLHELNTVAYWIMEKHAHSPRTRARINQIAQVVIDLSIKRGTNSLTILKAEKRHTDILNKPVHYWSKDLDITFEHERKRKGYVDIGLRIKALRNKRGISQKELAKLVGVTPSTISQVETNLIYPSIPALLKMAEVLSVDVSSFFQETVKRKDRPVFHAKDAVGVRLHALPEGSVDAQLLTPVDFDARAESYLLEIPAKKTLTSHFFISKGDEFGYLISGELKVSIGSKVHTLRQGDSICLTSEIPSQWKNSGPDNAVLLWVKIRL
jgi:transcriptional regulator with XRE-family HTH domain/KaiC/GvpD/RAD55 family RecA-like ATPase